MKTKRTLLPTWIVCAVALALNTNPAPATAARDAAGIPEASPAKTADVIPWSQIGAKAGAAYQGEGLSVTPTEHGARLRCVFQRLEGEATSEGLWLTSTVTNTAADRFRVKAAAVGRASADSLALPAAGTVKVSDKLVTFA